jgi:hypothetical protein
VCDRRVVHKVLAGDYFILGRVLVDEERPREARQAFSRALRHASGTPPLDTARALGWVAVLSLPEGMCHSVAMGCVGVRRAVARRGPRRPAVP